MTNKKIFFKKLCIFSQMEALTSTSNLDFFAGGLLSSSVKSNCADFLFAKAGIGFSRIPKTSNSSWNHELVDDEKIGKKGKLGTFSTITFASQIKIDRYGFVVFFWSTTSITLAKLPLPNF